MPSERDWKHLRQLHPVALDRFCSRILEECRSVLTEHDSTAHERYLKLVRLLRTRNDELAIAFDGMRRSRAIGRLVAMRRLERIRSVPVWWRGARGPQRRDVGLCQRRVAQRVRVQLSIERLRIGNAADWIRIRIH